MKIKKLIYLTFILYILLSGIFKNYNFLPKSNITRRIKGTEFFITVKELLEECDCNSPPAYSYLGERLPHGEWYYGGKIGFGEVRKVKGMEFAPPLKVVYKHTGWHQHFVWFQIISTRKKYRGG